MAHSWQTRSILGMVFGFALSKFPLKPKERLRGPPDGDDEWLGIPRGA